MNSAEHMTKEMDVLMRDDETPESLVAHLNERLQARVVISPEQYNSALTLLVTGTRAQVSAAFAWLATEGKPRFDLRGKPPVGKGQRRVHDYEPGDEQHAMAGDPDCRVCGQTRRQCEGPQ